MTEAYNNVLQHLETIAATHNNPYWNIDSATAHYVQQTIIEYGYTNAIEIGTSNGLSALYLAAALKHTGGTLITVESHTERYNLATQHFIQAHVTDIVFQVKGHAPEILDDIPGMFDFLFIDATSIEYHLYYTYLKSRILPGGSIVADNIVSHQEKVQPFINHIQQDSEFDVSIHDIGKGILHAIRI